MTLSLIYIILIVTAIIASIMLYVYKMRQQILRLKNEKRTIEEDFKRKELNNYMVQQAQKNTVLEQMKIELTKDESTIAMQKLITKINNQLKDETRWRRFTTEFELLHRNFTSAIHSRYQGITSKEMRLMALIRMNLQSRDIASLLNISQSGIKKARFRLRKKLDLSTADSLEEAIKNIN